MWLNGTPYAPRSPGDGAAAGIALIPEDRKEQSLVLFAPIRANVTVSILRRISRAADPRAPTAAARGGQADRRDVNVRMQSVDQPIGSLSGGNQQRAVFGRAFASQPAAAPARRADPRRRRRREGGDLRADRPGRRRTAWRCSSPRPSLRSCC